MSFAFFNTGNDGLNKMFGGIGDGIAYQRNGSFFAVVYGAAGSGKSILALQLCCCCDFRPTNESANEPDEHTKVVYISHEPEAAVKSRLENFNFFIQEKDKAPKRKVFTKNEKEGWFKKTGIHIVSMPLDVSSQIDVLMNIIDLAGQKRKKNSKEVEDKWLVVFDNAESISPEAYGKAFSLEKAAEFNPEYSPKDGVFFKNIRNHFIERGVSSFFFFEEPGDWEDGSTSSEVSKSAQAYAADVVIHLSRHSVPGYRQRTIEIVKARNQFHLRGRHHFSIVGTKTEGKQPTDVRDEMGVVIYPSLAARTHKLRTDKYKQDETGKAKNGDTLGFGIKELDDVLNKSDQEATSGKPADNKNETDNHGIQQGSSNVLVADLDDRATDLALHFALNEIKKTDDSNSYKTLYISFQRDVADLQVLTERFCGKGDGVKLVSEKKEAPCRVLYLTPEYIGDGKLLQDIELALKDDDDKVRPRVVIDNIFGIKSKFPLIQNPENFFATLFAILKARRVTTFLVDTVEAGEHANPIEKSMLAGMADNVFLLRHVEFQSKSRSVFSMLKLQGKPAPEQYWELNEKELTREDRLEKKRKLEKSKLSPTFCGRTELQAADTFDFFRDVLTGNPKPVQITLGVYTEGPGSPLDRYLQAQKTSFAQTFGESFKMEIYGAEEYARMQRSLEIASALPRSDCHIVAIDEFWLAHLLKKDLLENLYQPFDELSAVEPQESRKISLDRGNFVTCAHDIALLLRCQDPNQKLSEKRYAIAVRNNCGLICCNRQDLLLALESVDITRTANLIKWIKTGMAEKPITWKAITESKKQILEAYEKMPKEKRTEHAGYPNVPTVFFTFCMEHLESCVSFLLELALSTSTTIFADPKPKNDTVDPKPRELDFKAFKPALETLLKLIEHDDLVLLAAGRFRKYWEEPRALFSRQWWSTLGCLRSRGWPNALTIAEKETLGVSLSSINKPWQEDKFFRFLEAIELPCGEIPCGEMGKPTPISGSWYLGILKGSSAVKAGVRIITQFCLAEDDEYKLRNYIGMPVRAEFYALWQHDLLKASNDYLNPYGLPYAKQFAALAREKNISDLYGINEPGSTRYRLEKELYSDCPFYRMQIENYDRVAPILYRMMSKAAQEKLAITGEASDEQISTCAELAKDMGCQQYKMFKESLR
jgi:KaiC/GvpD/RAD55 family RecA-like ATPase